MTSETFIWSGRGSDDSVLAMLAILYEIYLSVHIGVRFLLKESIYVNRMVIVIDTDS